MRSMSRIEVEPGLVLPPQFRTVSFGIDERRRSLALDAADEKRAALSAKKQKKGSKSGSKAAEIELGNVDYHIASIDSLMSRLETSRNAGLSSAAVAQKIKTIGS